MANTHTQIFYHLIFSTKHRAPCLLAARRREFYAFLWGILKNLKCHLYRVGGTADHVHLLTGLHPGLALADFMSQLKTGSTHWIRREAVFADWPGWQDGYAAFTSDIDGKNGLIEYIKNQEEHHRQRTYLEEIQALFERAGIAYDPQYLE